MKKLLIIFSVFIAFNSCKQNNKLEPSFKALKSNKKEILEYYDSIRNIYSNYKYSIVFRLPEKWSYNEGTTEHMLMRAVKMDSLYQFSLNVVETYYNVEKGFWETYSKSKINFEKMMKEMMESKLNYSIKNYKTKT